MLVSLWAFRALRKQSHQPTGRHQEDKIEDKISPEGEKKWLAHSILFCLEGNTMRNRGAYLTKERMPSDSKQTPLAAWKAVPDWRCTALQAVVGIGAISPAHPRFSRMYGVTNSTVFQTVLNKRFFYDRRELFCPRILSFRSGSCWVRAHFLGKPQKVYQRK